MKYFAYILAGLLLLIWLAGFFIFKKGGILHALPVFAAVIVILRVIQGNMGSRNYTRHDE